MIDDESLHHVRHLNVLVVDDEINMRRTMIYCLEQEGHTAIAVSNQADALAEARRCAFDLAFVDLRLGKEDGMHLIEALQREPPWTKIVVITAYASVETAVEAMKKGATDYIPKPFTPDQVRLQTVKISQIRDMEREITELKDDVGRLDLEANFSSNNPIMQRTIETARKAADSEAIILLRGESGTGKSVMAKAIHQWSPRAEKSMGTVSCPAMPAELLESELFGHTKGAFTGAVRDNPGRIAACSGGTLFLDEIGDLPPELQVKLLRFIQERTYERLGDPKPRKADVRIIAATNANLDQRVADGRFREDLYYRLNVITLTMPPP
ncbi:MAG: sigma-54 dependent transcriptional regulator [Desulfobacterales bacterium]|nr:sigma-54 dependent transcriptional regulator [Desulfobacterales bacterium]